jgi:hypothetical protein
MKIFLTAILLVSMAGCQFCCDARNNGCAERCVAE